VVGVSGEHDRVQDVLKEVGVPHIVVSPMVLARTPLNAKQLLIINCAGSLGPQELEKVRKFVNAGGFLLHHGLGAHPRGGEGLPRLHRLQWARDGG